MTMQLAAVAAEPKSRAEWRERLLADVESIADVLERTALESDLKRALPADVITALRSTKLLEMKMPAVLGGAEADNALQFEIFERVAYYNAAASWCLFIYADILGKLGGHLSEDGLKIIFGSGTPLVCGGGGLIMGELKQAPGGYRVSGRWIYGSGIDAADWLIVPATRDANSGPHNIFYCVVPRSELEVFDNWHVLGLRGTGSSDFQADDLFVPEELTFAFSSPPVRGGGIFRLGMMGYVSHTVPATAMGIARRALDDVRRIAMSKVKSYSKRTPLAHRGVFQNFLGEADIKLRAARALMIENGVRIVEDAERLGSSPPENEAEVRAAASYATQVAVDVVNEAVRYAGGDGVRQGARLEQALRDVHMAATHAVVTNSTFENHAQFIMGLEGADVLA